MADGDNGNGLKDLGFTGMISAHALHELWSCSVPASTITYEGHMNVMRPPHLECWAPEAGGAAAGDGLA